MRRVFKQFAVVLLVAAASSAILSGCSGSKAGGGGGKDVAATVNGKEITLSDVDRIINKQTNGQQSKMSAIQQAAARLQVLDNLIQREAVVQRAEKEKAVPNDDEINTAINSQKSQMTAEEWQKFLQENNLTEEQLRDEARKELAVKKIQEKIYGQITIRDQEVTDFYNNNSAQFVNPRGVGLSDIVADARDSGGAYGAEDAKSEAEAAAKINRIYTQLKAGADFATVARASSEDPTGLQRGGDIGFANEDDLRQTGFPQELIARLFGPMSVGDITEPIRFPDGRWIIFKLTSRQLESKPLKLEDAGVRDQIKNALISQRQTILQEALIRNAMSEATVSNKLAESMLKDPNMLGGLQQAAPAGASATPAASASPAATATASPSPAASASPAAGNRPVPGANAKAGPGTAAPKK